MQATPDDPHPQEVVNETQHIDDRDISETEDTVVTTITERTVDISPNGRRHMMTSVRIVRTPPEKEKT